MSHSNVLIVTNERVSCLVRLHAIDKKKDALLQRVGLPCYCLLPLPPPFHHVNIHIYDSYFLDDFLGWKGKRTKNNDMKMRMAYRNGAAQDLLEHVFNCVSEDILHGPVAFVIPSIDILLFNRCLKWLNEYEFALLDNENIKIGHRNHLIDLK
jgi:hypothetical protein